MGIIRGLNIICLAGLVLAAALTMLTPYHFPHSQQVIPGNVTPRAWLQQTMQVREHFSQQTGYVASQETVHAWTLSHFGFRGCYRELRAPFLITCVAKSGPHNLPLILFGFGACALFGLGNFLTGLLWQWRMVDHYRRTAPAGYRPPRLVAWPLKRAHRLHGVAAYWPLMSRGDRVLLVLQWFLLIAVAACFHLYNSIMLAAASS